MQFQTEFNTEWNEAWQALIKYIVVVADAVF